MLDERFDRVRPRLRDAQKALRREREKASALRQRIGTADDPAREAFLKHRDVVDALFGVTVLDPAMGSGHFLVEAVDYITDRLLDFLNGFPWNPVVQQLDETRQSILHELQHLVFDLYGLTPDDVDLLRSTAPPRDPLALVESAGAKKAVAAGGTDGASSAGGVP